MYKVVNHLILTYQQVFICPCSYYKWLLQEIHTVNKFTPFRIVFISNQNLELFTPTHDTPINLSKS